MKTTIYFKMQIHSEEEKVTFQPRPTPDEVDEYFEKSCGGVYEWDYSPLNK